MFGLGLVLTGCHFILRFASMYYEERKGNYSAPEQAALDNLFEAARAIEAVLTPLLLP